MYTQLEAGTSSSAENHMIKISGCLIRRNLPLVFTKNYEEFFCCCSQFAAPIKTTQIHRQTQQQQQNNNQLHCDHCTNQSNQPILFKQHINPLFRLWQTDSSVRSLNKCFMFVSNQSFEILRLKSNVYQSSIKFTSHFLQIIIWILCINFLFTSTTASVLKENCRKVGHRSIIDEEGCDLVAVSVNSCSGYCLSFSFPNPLDNNKMTSFSKCCAMIEIEMIDVSINCTEGIRKIKFPSAKECGCFECSRS